MHILVLFTAVCLVSFTTANPTEKFPGQYTGSNLDYLVKTYRGIYWQDAGKYCSDDQLNILAETTRMLAPYSEIDPFHWDETTGFNRFFMNPRKAKQGQSWHDSATNQDAYLSIKRFTGESAIYGSWKCSNWAWKYQTNGLGPVNIRTAVNADNYAWALTNNWLNGVYKWNEVVTSGLPPASGGFRPGRKRDDSSSSSSDFYPSRIDNLDPPNPESETPDDTVEASSIPDSSFQPAPNCHKADSQTVGDGDDPVVCDYVGGDYSDFLASQTNTFKSSGGCDLSNPCKTADGNAIDPKCTCSCDGDLTPLTDGRCAGFQGALPNPGRGSGTGP